MGGGGGEGSRERGRRRRGWRGKGIVAQRSELLDQNPQQFDPNGRSSGEEEEEVDG